MIRNSFIFLDKISNKSENNIWKSGILTWEQFLESRSVPGMGLARKTLYDMQIEKAQKNLEAGNADFFTAAFPRSEHWRLYDEFRDDVLFLDIETSSRYDITVIGLYDGEHSQVFVRGKNLNKESFQRALRDRKILVTFNGSSFDIPVIERYFGMKIFMPHIDLRHVCLKLGLKGGLKAIEREIGIRRPLEVANMQGGDAVVLWHMYSITGKDKYLERLIEYNLEDAVNLEQLAGMAIPRLWQKTHNLPLKSN